MSSLYPNQLLDAIRRFELVRLLLGHEAVLTQEELKSMLGAQHWAHDFRFIILVRYGAIMRRRVEEHLQHDKEMGATTSTPVVPVVDVAAATLRHTTCTGNTVLVVQDDRFWVERPNEQFSAKSGRDVAIMWIAGLSARELFETVSGRRGRDPQQSREKVVRPTQLAVMEAVCLLARLGLDDDVIGRYAREAGDDIDLARVWVSVEKYMYVQYLHENRALWQGWLERHPEAILPAEVEETRRWLASTPHPDARGLYKVSAAQPPADEPLAEWERTLRQGAGS